MIGSLRVFISSTCNDLFQERRDVATGLLAAGHSVILSELPQHMPVNPRLSCIDNCLEAVTKHCDVLVVVISGHYGSTDSSGQSITLREYLHARSLGIPIVTYVHKTVLQLVPVYKANPNTLLSPIISDNRVFEFVVRVMDESSGNWVIPFEDAATINESLKYQLSCLLRTHLGNRPQASEQPVYAYIGNSTHVYGDDGASIRMLEYVLRNDTTDPIEQVYGGDNSDRAMTFDEMQLCVLDEHGQQLNWKPIIETPGFRRWDIILREPILPGKSLKYFTSFRSYDHLQMQTWVNQRVDIGVIRCLLPRSIVLRPIECAIREATGWRDAPAEASSREIGEYHLVTCTFQNRAGSFHFRTKWG